MKGVAKTSGSIWARGPFWFGVVLSFIVVSFGWYSLTQWPICGEVGPCMSNWDQLRYHSSPNEIGDMLAGFAGALAFIWIVVTVLLQAAELREQREQFEKMANAQAGQENLLIEQGKIFKKEQEERELDSLARLTDELVASLRWKMETTIIQWVGEPTGYGDVPILDIFSTHIDGELTISDERFFRKVRCKLIEIPSQLASLEKYNPVSKYPQRFELGLIYHDVKVALHHVGKLSMTEQTRLNRLELLPLKEAMSALTSNGELWAKEETE